MTINIFMRIPNRWQWCMDYCRLHRLPPTNPHFWKEANDAYDVKFGREAG